MGDAVQQQVRGIFAQLEIVFERVRSGDLLSLYAPEEWLNLAVTAAGFALAGALVGMVFGRSRRAGARADGAQPKSKSETPPSDEDPATRAHEKYRTLLAGKRIPAADIEVRWVEFQHTFDAARDRLQALGIDETAAAALFVQARDALQDGEYRRVVNLVCLAADKCAEESGDRRTAAERCARTAIVARALAGELEMAQFEYAAAAELFGQAAAGAPEGDEDFLAAQLEKQGTAAYLAGDHKTALAAFQRALALLEGKLGPDHADVAAALNNLALAHYAKGDLDAAEPLYGRALKIDEAALGADHPGTATDLGNLALLHQKRQDHAKAEPMFRRALEIVESAYDSRHPSVVKAMRNYSVLLREMSRDAEADDLERRANGRSQATETAQ
jgi:tetratricopeptide (TPR) repeat protein